MMCTARQLLEERLSLDRWERSGVDAVAGSRAWRNIRYRSAGIVLGVICLAVVK